MKSVLASLKPYYYYLVGEGIKEIEVSKNMPRASDWNKEVLFYMSKDVKSFAKIPKEFQEKYRKHFGKVGMQFVCERIVENFKYLVTPKGLECACLSEQEVCDYLGFNGGYGWDISNLKVYDKPKELGEFKKPCDRFLDCCTCKRLVRNDIFSCDSIITRPPQSWCYVESLGE